MTALTYNSKNPSEWVIRRCIDSFKNEYEFWPGYCERALTLEELVDALVECSRLWPRHTFSGHKLGPAHPLRFGRRWPAQRHGHVKSAINPRRRRLPDARPTRNEPVRASRRYE
jgi:hypothetical protein